MYNMYRHRHMSKRKRGSFLRKHRYDKTLCQQPAEECSITINSTARLFMIKYRARD